MKQVMQDRPNNVMMEYLEATSKTREYCISLIKSCTSFKATELPTFDEIIDVLKQFSTCISS